MVRKILLLSASAAFFISQPTAAVCLGDLEMHGSGITGLASQSAADGSGDAANKTYVDNYVARLDADRRNGTMMSTESTSGVWFDAQDFCNELVSPAILPDGTATGTVSEAEYDDWHLPSRVEWLAACMHHGSKLNYAEKSWTAGGLCSDDAYSNAFWTEEFHHTSPLTWVKDQPWEQLEVQLDKYDFLILGKAETFDPQTGTSMRVSADEERNIRCIR